MMTDTTQQTGKPLFVYDGDCGFCRTWVARFRARTGDQVEYAPYQEVASQFPHIPVERFVEAAHLIEASGETTFGAEAIFRTMRYAPRRGWMLWGYQHIPVAAPVSELGYRFVAGHRKIFSLITKMFWGSSLGEPTHHLARWLFLKLLGIVYLIAFGSMLVQILGLIGEQGILPADDYLSFVQDRLGQEKFWRVPTLCWFSASDSFLQFLCYGGAGLSILLILGITPIPVLILLWIFYLSICSVGGVFLSFQWDIFLLETGFLGIFFAPLGFWPTMSRSAHPSKIVLLLIRWLLFRLMLMSGVVKLASGDAVWHNLTALTIHYETQPLPTWTSWYAHQLPLWFQKFCCGVMFVIELVIPFFIFGPRRLRQIACFLFLLLMVLIALTGNYTFFNLLTGVLCIVLLDDAFLKRFFPARQTNWLEHSHLNKRGGWLRGITCVALAMLIIPISTVQGLRRTTNWNYVPTSIQTLITKASPFRSVNNYGLFANMTETRPEVVIEGSNDRRTWLEYEFHYKPGDVKRHPKFVQPHQPRLDWQMWFAALGNYQSQRNQFVTNMMHRILQDSPEVMKFFAHNPFPDEPPIYIRAVRYRYTFTDFKTRSETGAWWHREWLGLYTPVISRPLRASP